MWQTSRLNIRQFRIDDWQDLHALQGDPEATRFLGGPWSEEKTREVTARIIGASGVASIVTLRFSAEGPSRYTFRHAC